MTDLDHSRVVASTSGPVILGSRSPQRLDLLQQIVAADRITVCPPLNADEAGFDDLNTLDEFAERMREIVDAKSEDVIGQVECPGPAVVICADTTIIGCSDRGRIHALGQPPEDDWQNVVRQWFRDYFAGRTHTVMSGVSLSVLNADGIQSSTWRTCQTRVTMREDADAWLDWYISTGEPRGKAGGYAIQGAGSVMVTAVEGSLSNVIGLPLEDTIEMLRELR